MNQQERQEWLHQWDRDYEARVSAWKAGYSLPVIPQDLSAQILTEENLRRALEDVLSHPPRNPEVTAMLLKRLVFDYRQNKQPWSLIFSRPMDSRFAQEVMIRLNEQYDAGASSVWRQVLQRAIFSKITPFLENAWEETVFSYRQYQHGFAKALNRLSAMNEPENAWSVTGTIEIPRYNQATDEQSQIDVLTAMGRTRDKMRFVFQDMEPGYLVKYLWNGTYNCVAPSILFNDGLTSDFDELTLSRFAGMLFMDEIDQELKYRRRPFVRFGTHIALSAKTRKSLRNGVDRLVSYLEQELHCRLKIAEEDYRPMANMEFLGMYQKHGIWHITDAAWNHIITGTKVAVSQIKRQERNFEALKAYLFEVLENIRAINAIDPDEIYDFETRLLDVLAPLNGTYDLRHIFPAPKQQQQ